jgi:hypothetical protein
MVKNERAELKARAQREPNSHKVRSTRYRVDGMAYIIFWIPTIIDVNDG